MRTFEFRDGKSSKFWGIDLQGKGFTVRYGKVGTAGQTQTKEFADAAKAKKEHDKLIAEKLAKGYVEAGGAGAKAAVKVRSRQARQV
jgi:predicted DNA-binding WGR domain protein